MNKFAVNIIGYVEDSLDKYTSDQLEQMLLSESVTHCFKPLNTVAVIVKKLDDDAKSLSASKARKHYRVSLSRK